MSIKSNIKPIDYYCWSTNYNDEDNNIPAKSKISFKSVNNMNDREIHHIHIEPETYRYETPLDQLRKNCLVNLSDIAHTSKRSSLPTITR